MGEIYIKNVKLLANLNNLESYVDDNGEFVYNSITSSIEKLNRSFERLRKPTEPSPYQPGAYNTDTNADSMIRISFAIITAYYTSLLFNCLRNNECVEYLTSISTDLYENMSNLFTPEEIELQENVANNITSIYTNYIRKVTEEMMKNSNFIAGKGRNRIVASANVLNLNLTESEIIRVSTTLRNFSLSNNTLNAETFTNAYRAVTISDPSWFSVTMDRLKWLIGLPVDTVNKLYKMVNIPIWNAVNSIFNITSYATGAIATFTTATIVYFNSLFTKILGLGYRGIKTALKTVLYLFILFLGGDIAIYIKNMISDAISGTRYTEYTVNTNLKLRNERWILKHRDAYDIKRFNCHKEKKSNKRKNKNDDDDEHKKTRNQLRAQLIKMTIN